MSCRLTQPDRIGLRRSFGPFRPINAVEAGLPSGMHEDTGACFHFRWIRVPHSPALKELFETGEKSSLSRFASRRGDDTLNGGRGHAWLHRWRPDVHGTVHPLGRTRQPRDDQPQETTSQRRCDPRRKMGSQCALSTMPNDSFL